MKLINKSNNSISPYTYLIKFFHNDRLLMYYGVRYGNVKLGLSPSNDLFQTYFTSSKDVNNLIKLGVMPFEVIVHKTFSTVDEACQFEVDILTRLDAMHDERFLNHTNTFKNDRAYSNKNRILSKETKDKIGKASREWQSSKEYKELRRISAKERWADPKFREYMNDRNSAFFESNKGQTFIKEHLNKIWEGRAHSEITKQKISDSAKRALQNVDMSKRALNRKRYICPICHKFNLDGGNFNRHMIKNHQWSKEECQIFKNNIH